MEVVGKIVFNQLASRKAVALPGVGTLWTEVAPSEQVSSAEILPSANVVHFSVEPHDGEESVIDLLEAQGVLRQDAEAVYNKWLDGARTTEGVNLDEAGRVVNGMFIPSKELSGVLNPYGDPKPERVGKGWTRSEVIWLILILLFILILLVGWLGWYKGYKKDDMPPDRGVAVEKAEGTKSLQDSGGDNASVTGQAASDVAPSASATPAAPAVSQAQTQSGSTPAAAVSAPSGTRYYVVGGVFSIPSNADKYINSMKRDYPDLNYEKTIYKDKTMVSIFSTTDGAEAARVRNRLATQTYNPELWVYKSVK